FKLDIEQRRRERFKKTVVTAVIVSVAVVIGLLIEGCVSEKSQVADEPGQVQSPAPSVAAAPAQPVQPSISRVSPPVQPCPVVTAPQQTATPADPLHVSGAAVYRVKSGDTLTRIAKIHHTTIKAIKELNRLATDRISVGQKLNLPAA
ncbi:MAG: LysM peptidoglycan-binding domain-containing protein, partial [Limisphaerales bacterium]